VAPYGGTTGLGFSQNDADRVSGHPGASQGGIKRNRQPVGA